MTSTELPMSNMPAARRPDSGAASEINVGYYERMASVVGGPLLAVYGLARGMPAGLGLALAGGYLFYRGWTGRCPAYKAIGISTATQQGRPLHVEHSVTIDRPAEELYRFWRDFENLPRFMKHLESVRATGDRSSHWAAKAPAGRTVEWDAEITDDRPNELIAWRSLEGSDVDSVGTVRLERAPGGRGTIVRVEMRY